MRTRCPTLGQGPMAGWLTREAEQGLANEMRVVISLRSAWVGDISSYFYLE